MEEGYSQQKRRHLSIHTATSSMIIMIVMIIVVIVVIR